jgi:hypothetical protein
MIAKAPENHGPFPLHNEIRSDKAMNRKRTRTLLWLVALVLAQDPGAAQAASIVFDVSMNTAPLVGNGNTPFALDFQLNDGSGPAGNNTAAISQVTGATLGAVVPGNIGTFSGNLSSTLMLTDANPATDYAQFFTPGSTLGFHVVLTTNLNTNPPLIADQFSFAILFGASFDDLPTHGSQNQFVSVDITVANPPVATFASDSSQAPHITIAAPTISIPSAVPEPSSLVLLALGLGGVVLVQRSRRRTRPSHRAE